MTNAEATSYSFLLRLWAEGLPADPGPVHWRGHITNLIDERRRYVETLDDIVAFIQQYLDLAGGRSPDGDTDEDVPQRKDRPVEPPGGRP